MHTSQAVSFPNLRNYHPVEPPSWRLSLPQARKHGGHTSPHTRPRPDLHNIPRDHHQPVLQLTWMTQDTFEPLPYGGKICSAHFARHTSETPSVSSRKQLKLSKSRKCPLARISTFDRHIGFGHHVTTCPLLENAVCETLVTKNGHVFIRDLAHKRPTAATREHQ